MSMQRWMKRWASIWSCAIVFALASSDARAQLVDCNDNGVADGTDITSGASDDCNLNGIPDECECLADDDMNGVPDACEPGQCGCMDVVFVVDITASMAGAINKVKSGLDDIIDVARFAAGADPLLGGNPANLRMALITFKDTVQAEVPFTSNLTPLEDAVNDIVTGGGGEFPEASDEAMSLAINDVTNCGTGSIGSFRSECQRVVILATDQVPGGCDDEYTIGVDDVAAMQLADDAAAAGILVSAIYVDTFSADPTAIPLMQNYATVTGGQYAEAASDGTGTDDGISEIIEACGESITDCNMNGIADECDLEQGRAFDCNNNGILDECEGGADTDGDGALDECDGCPLDPDKVEPGFCGCGVSDVDSDGDGTPNCVDGCPFDPNKTEPGDCGCGIADGDADGDGVANCDDGCPNDPDKIDPGICGCGTPDTDDDGDGTPNCFDGCPNDPDKIEPGDCGCGVPDGDADGDGVQNCDDNCELFNPDQTDCDGNGIGDVCDVANPLNDCNDNGVPDECDLLTGFSQDCNGNGRPDECDIAFGPSEDCQPNGVPDECEPDCNNNGVPDVCDISGGGIEDCNNDGIPDSCQGGTIPGRPDPEGSSDRVLRGYLVGWAVNQENEQIKWNYLTGEVLCIDYREGAAWEYRGWTAEALPDVPDGATVGQPGEIRLDGLEFAAPYDHLMFPFQPTGSIKLSATDAIVAETDLTLHPVSLNVFKNNSTGPANTMASFAVWNENGTKFTGPERCIQCWDQSMLQYYDDPANFSVSVLQTNNAYARIDGVQDSICDPGAVNPSAPEALLGTRVTIGNTSSGKMMAGGAMFGEGAQEAIILYDPLDGSPPERAVPRSMVNRNLADLPYMELVDRLALAIRDGDRGVRAVDDLFEALVAKSNGRRTLSNESNVAPRNAARAEVLGDDAPRMMTSHAGSLIIFSNVEVRWDVEGNIVQDCFISLTNHADEDIRVQFYFINGDPPVPFDPTGEVCAQPGWNFVDNEIGLTAEQPTYWSVLTGEPGPNGPLSPFTILDE